MNHLEDYSRIYGSFKIKEIKKKSKKNENEIKMVK